MKVGDTVYYVISSRAIREATVVRVTPAMYILRYLGGAISLPRSRVYATKEEAAKHVIVRSRPADIAPQSHGNQMALREAYDYSGRDAVDGWAE